MEMVTRYAGEAHITAEGWGDLNRGIVGTESYALPMGREFEADLVSNNLLKIYDGCGVMQGREVRIPAGQSEEVTIENGTQGEKRIDLVVERYSKNEDTKIESSETILIKGTPSETDPQVPDHIEGDIRAGDMTADWPLYEVELDGINVVAVRPVFGILMNMAVLKEMVSDLSSKTKVETFELIPSSNVNTLAQKCYYEPLTGRVHIEAAHYTEGGIKPSMDLAIVPAKYAPKATTTFPLSMSDTGGLGYIYTDGKIRQNASSVQAFAYYSTDYFI